MLGLMLEPVDLPQGAWMVLAGLIGLAVLAVLHTFACAVRNETYIHSLRISVLELRRKYIRELRTLHGLDPDGGEDGEIMEVGGVDDEPPVMVSTRQPEAEAPRKAA